jgi:hypothetical protein
MVFGGSADESLVQTWIRRGITVPAFILCWLFMLVTMPLSLPIAFVYDLFRHRKFPAVRTILMVFMYFTAANTGVAAALASWLRWRLTPQSREAFMERQYAIQRWWAMTLYRAAVRLYGIKLDIEERGMENLGPCIIFVRHVCVFDNLVPYVTITERHGIFMRWALNRYLLRDPAIDIVGGRLVNAFVRNDRRNGDKEVQRVVALLDELGGHEGVQMFPEGALFNSVRRQRILKRLAESSDAYLLERARRLTNTLPPRLGGTIGLLKANPGLDAVFISHTGLEGAGSYRRILRGALVGKHVRVRIWRVPFAEIPTGEQAQIDWFYSQWERVDRFVGEEADEEDLAPVLAGAAR